MTEQQQRTLVIGSHEVRPGTWRVEGRIKDDDGFMAIEHIGRPWKVMVDFVEKDMRALLAVVRPHWVMTVEYINGEAEHLIHEPDDGYGWTDWDEDESIGVLEVQP